MPTDHHFVLLRLRPVVIGAALLASACSDSNSDPAVVVPEDASHDALPDSPLPDASSNVESGLAESSTDSSTEADSADGRFGISHGELRPDCPSVLDPKRVPFALPQVVAKGWSEPVKLNPPLNTDCPEDAIEVSRDGTTLYVQWSPQVNAPALELTRGTTGMYVAQRSGTDPGSFGTPTFFDLRQGTKDGAFDGELSFTPAGDRVFFHSTRAENLGLQQDPPLPDTMDIYVAQILSGVPQPAANLGPPVNTVYREGEHCLNPEGTQLFFASDRPNGLGQVDLWVSERSGDTWGEPKNLGATLNTAGREAQPAFAAMDPDTLFFMSDRLGPSGIFRSVRNNGVWGAPEQVLAGYVGEPTLVADGSVLYFVHVLVDAQGVYGSDVWYVTRTE